MSYYRASKEFTGYANSFQSIARLGLESINALLNNLDNPQNSLKFIHVAGTNGKGSVCVFLQTMLSHAGFKTGIYTSPNMICVNERIRIGQNEISDDDMKRILDKVEKACEKTEEQIGLYPTQFEIWTAMAMCYFMENNCDYVVLETGLGGRLDATNVITTTTLSIITHIALDHTQYLGNTLSQIAFEKAGIIKPNTHVITAQQDEEALGVIKDVCKKNKCLLTTAPNILPDKFDGIHEIISEGSFSGTTLSLGGINQIDNASCAIEAARAIGIDEASIKYGLTHASHMGRFELVAHNTYFDGAHNPDGIKSLKNNLDRYFCGRQKVYIMAAMADKEIDESLKILHEDNAEFKMVSVENNERAMSSEMLCKKALALGLDAKAYQSITDAYHSAVKSGKLIVICGSLYLYKDFALSGLIKNS